MSDTFRGPLPPEEDDRAVSLLGRRATVAVEGVGTFEVLIADGALVTSPPTPERLGRQWLSLRGPSVPK